MVSYVDIETLTQYGNAVLILIVVEDGLVLGLEKMYKADLGCLNPYCSGRWSRTSSTKHAKPWVLLS